MIDRRKSDELWPALGILAAVWSALLAQPWVAMWTEPEVATLICFAVAAAAVIIPSLPLRLSRNDARTVAAGILAGAALRWAAGTVVPEAGDRGEPGLMALVARGILAPVFEETLYREWLIVPIRRRLGTLGAITITSVLFALPHISPVLVAQAFVMGVGLGAARILGNSLALCVGLHAGWNLGGLGFPGI